MSRKGSNIQDLCFMLAHTKLSSVESLLSHGQRADIAGPDGRTPLLQAVESGDTDRFDLLYRYGAKVNHRDRQKRNSLHVAALSRQEGMIHKICRLPVDKDTLDGDGMTPLMISLAIGATNITKLLLSHGCNVNAGSVHIEELSALHLAIIKPECQESVITDLLTAGAEVNVTDAVGRTPLIYAIKARSVCLMKILLERQADPDKSDPFSHAYDLQFTEGVLLLLSYGASAFHIDDTFSHVNIFSESYLPRLSEIIEKAYYQCDKHTYLKIIESIIAEDGGMTSGRSGRHRLFRAKDHQPPCTQLFYKLLAYGFDVGTLCGKCICLNEKCDKKAYELASKLSIPTPLPLTVLSRNTIRQCLGRGVSRKAKCLNIPVRFQNFLSDKVLDDKDWMVDEYHH